MIHFSCLPKLKANSMPFLFKSKFNSFIWSLLCWHSWLVISVCLPLVVWFPGCSVKSAFALSCCDFCAGYLIQTHAFPFSLLLFQSITFVLSCLSTMAIPVLFLSFNAEFVFTLAVVYFLVGACYAYAIFWIFLYHFQLINFFMFPFSQK